LTEPFDGTYQVIIYVVILFLVSCVYDKSGCILV
jgi:hypothetical protein